MSLQYEFIVAFLKLDGLNKRTGIPDDTTAARLRPTVAAGER